jgi:hypothetical protein
VTTPYLPPATGRIVLTSGESAVTKGVLGSALIAAMLLLAPLLAIILGAGLGVAVGVLTLLALWSVLFWAVMHLFRSAAWLEGTTLVARSAFTVRRCDLATAPHVTLESVPEVTMVAMQTNPAQPGSSTQVPVRTGRNIPLLTVYDRAGRSVRLALIDRAKRRWLAPQKLHALADAILAGPRPEPQAAQAWWVASGLRTMAADPTGRIR